MRSTFANHAWSGAGNARPASWRVPDHGDSSVPCRGRARSIPHSSETRWPTRLDRDGSGPLGLQPSPGTARPTPPSRRDPDRAAARQATFQAVSSARRTRASRRCRRLTPNSSFRAALERPAAPKEKSPVRSDSPVRLVLRLDDVEKPVTVARLLTRHGCRAQAHDASTAAGNRRRELRRRRARLVCELAARGVERFRSRLPSPT